MGNRKRRRGKGENVIFCSKNEDGVISCFRTPDFACYRFRPEEEAKKEGFMTYEGLINFFAGKNIDIMDTYRIEFEVMK